MNDNQTVVRLAKPRKKGLLRLLFSRLFIIAALLILQLLLIVALNFWLTEQLPFFVGLESLFTLAMVIYLFNNDMDSAAKLTWLFIISILPLPGAMLLAFTQTPSIRTLNTILKNGQDKAEAPVEETKSDTQHGITRGAAYFRKGGASK